MCAQAACSSQAAAGPSEHGIAPKGRGSSLMQCSLTRYGPTKSGAARAPQARVLRLLPRESERSSAIACVHTNKPHACRRPCLARLRMALHRTRGGFRWCSAPPTGIGQLQPARRGAHAPQARVLRLLPRESQRSGAPVRLPRESRLCNGHVAARSCTEWERPLAHAVVFRSA